jgi:hypothetical protein
MDLEDKESEIHQQSLAKGKWTHLALFIIILSGEKKRAGVVQGKATTKVSSSTWITPILPHQVGRKRKSDLMKQDKWISSRRRDDEHPPKRNKVLPQRLELVMDPVNRRNTKKRPSEAPRSRWHGSWESKNTCFVKELGLR